MRFLLSLKSLRAIILSILVFWVLSSLFLASPTMAATVNPVVTSTNPIDKQEGADINRPIYITFDQEMDPLSMTSTSIVIQDSQLKGVQARGIHYDNTSKTTVLIPLASLKQDETYKVTLTTGVKNKMNLPLLQDYSFSFKTTLSSPTPEPLVVETIPRNLENPIGIKKVISASFNHDMDPVTISAATFIVEDANKNQVLAKSVTYDSSSRIAAFIPASPLIVNTQYTVTLKKVANGIGIKDSAGITLTKDYTWSFTTGDVDLYNPHGNYADNTNVCATCHQTHTALGKSLLNKTTETALCFTCHDGSGSQYNVNAGMVDTTNNQSFHPIMDTGNLKDQQLLQCSDCHNPHGNVDAQGNMNKKLLRATDGTTKAYQGNDFCLICHGANDRKFTDTYYSNTAGNHTNTIAAHYDTTKASLLPASGTNITCSKCHTSHSGRYNQLTDLQEENLCLTCHANPANSHSGKGNIQEQFFGSSTVTIVSKHDITSLNNGKVECSSCHGPHTVGAASLSEGKVYSDLADPTNTKSVFTTVAGTPNATIGNMSSFCLSCHGGAPPVAVHSLTKVVPFTIIFPQITFINSGWNKSGYLSSKHFLKGIGCEQCHEPHGSQYPSLQSRGEDTPSTSGECLTCHVNVSSALNQASHHPTIEISGKHKDTETVADKLNSSNRHAECVDCHDPHSPSKTVKQGKDLCYDCHSSSAYTGASQNGTTSNFSLGTENLHIYAKHSDNVQCTSCHVTIPHGSSYKSLLSTGGDIQSFNFKLDSNNQSIYPSNNWTKDSCTTSCHTVQALQPNLTVAPVEGTSTSGVVPTNTTSSTTTDSTTTSPTTTTGTTGTPDAGTGAEGTSLPTPTIVDPGTSTSTSTNTSLTSTSTSSSISSPPTASGSLSPTAPP